MKTKLLWLFPLLAIWGCMIDSDYSKSVPSGKGFQGQLHHEKMILQDIEIHVEANNEIVIDESVRLFGIPVSGDSEKAGGGNVFGMRVGFLTNNNNFTINLYKIKLSVDESMNIRPVKYLYLQHSEKTKGIKRENTNDGFVACGSWEVGSKFKNIINTQLKLPEIGLWNCFELLFEIPPPDPKQQILIKIEGVEKNGQIYDIPQVKFRETIFRHRDFAP